MMSKAMEGRRHRISVGDRRSWRHILSRLFRPHVWTAVGEGEIRDGNQARAGWTPKYLILLGICIGWSIKRQLTARFDEARTTVSMLEPPDDPLPQSYQGFFKQLGRFDVPLVHSVMEQLRQEARRSMRGAWFLHNWVPFAVDGSRVEAPRTAANEEYMGCAGRSGTGPQMWVTMITHLPSSLPWDWRQGPGRSSERAHLLDMLGSLPERSLVIGDAGFVSYEGMSEMEQAGQPFLIRVGGNFSLLLDGQPIPSRLERTRHGILVYLWPDRIYRKRLAPLVLRLIVLKGKGTEVYLLTNVRSSTELPKWMAFELYRARWGIEVTYRSLKQTMDRRRLLSKSPANANMELAIYILALFLLVLHGIVVMGSQCVRLSIAAALAVMHTAMEAIRWDFDWRDFTTKLARATRDKYHRAQSKRARDWPHKKTEKPPGPPKLRRLTAAHRKRLRELARQAKTG